LAVEGYEAITIVLIVAVMFLWGPQKLPEMAKMIGEARRELEKASKEPLSLLTLPSSASAQTATKTKQDPVLVAAKSLGLTTEGKTKDELVKEIVSRTAKKEQSPMSLPVNSEKMPPSASTPST
jgi:sec-independent protein translocase protein TatA